MASAFSHTLVALALGAVFPEEKLPRRAWGLGMACSLLPDVDIVGFLFGIPYAHVLGHRGFTHSFVFAALLSGLLVALIVRFGRWPSSRPALLLYLFLCTASHGVLDAMTNGGLGIAFFAPLDNTRYFLSWRPIEVSPIGIDAFLSERGLRVLWSEARTLWLPLFALWVTIRGFRTVTRRRKLI